MTLRSTALLTDFYQLTMAHAYFELGMHETAVFELFARRLPTQRRFLLAAGLAQAVDYLQKLRFSAEELEFLAGLGSFSTPFLDYLAQLRFTGSVDAMAEGTPFFVDEPVLRITAPLLEAQLVESRLLNIIHFQTLIASKAARCVLVAGERQLIDFGMRRAHEADAGVYAARAAYLAGFHGTATVEAGRCFGIPLSGTMAHSFIEANDSEEQAFRNFVMSRPTGVTLLIDTYDTERAAHRVVSLARGLQQQGSGKTIDAVRIDSGDLPAQARVVRHILDTGGCQNVRIVLSGGMDEYVIDQFVQTGVPVDVFGVGTSLDVSVDVPALDLAYKLQLYAGKPRRKWSPGKATWPGAKQVFRVRDAGDGSLNDRIALVGEQFPGTPLLAPVMSKGRLTQALPALSAIRNHSARELQSLPSALRSLENEGSGVSVQVSDALRALATRADAAII
jgi:nicotinate phosphoribosyltransferase